MKGRTDKRDGDVDASEVCVALYYKCVSSTSPLRTARVISRDWSFPSLGRPKETMRSLRPDKNASRDEEGHGARWRRSPLPRRRSPLSHRPRARVIAASRPAHRRYRSGPPPPRRRSSPRCPTRTSAASWTAPRSSRCRTPSAGRSSARRSSADPGSSSSQTSRNISPDTLVELSYAVGDVVEKNPGVAPEYLIPNVPEVQVIGNVRDERTGALRAMFSRAPPCPPTRARANRRCGTIPS